MHARVILIGILGSLMLGCGGPSERPTTGAANTPDDAGKTPVASVAGTVPSAVQATSIPSKAASTEPVPQGVILPEEDSDSGPVVPGVPSTEAKPK